MAEDSGETSTIEPKEEGPKQKIEATLSISEYLRQPLEKREEWVKEQLKIKLSDSRIKDVFLSDNDGYAFRCFKRRSDGEPLNKDYPDSTYEQALSNLHQQGIEINSSISQNWVSPRAPWMDYFLPNNSDFKSGVDTSIGVVYLNRPFVVGNPYDSNRNYIIDPDDPQYNVNHTYRDTVPISKAKDMPTLRDNFVGYVEVKWVKPESRISQLSSRLRGLVK